MGNAHTSHVGGREGPNGLAEKSALKTTNTTDCLLRVHERFCIAPCCFGLLRYPLEAPHRRIPQHAIGPLCCAVLCCVAFCSVVLYCVTRDVVLCCAQQWRGLGSRLRVPEHYFRAFVVNFCCFNCVVSVAQLVGSLTAQHASSRALRAPTTSNPDPRSPNILRKAKEPAMGTEHGPL